MNSTMKVKIVYGDDVRRWRLPEASKEYSNKFSLLQAFVKESFGFENDSRYFIQYLDDENDKITMACDKDFEDAILSAKQDCRKSLKLFVNDNDVASGESSFVFTREAAKNDQELESSPDSSVSSFDESNQNKEAKCEEKQDSNCISWRELALDFLEDGAIQTLLPQLVRRVIVALKANVSEKVAQPPATEEKKMDDNENDKENEKKEAKDFGTILIEILSEPEFEVISSHKLVETKLAFVLPLICEKVKMHENLLLSMNEDAIVGWVPHLVQILIGGLKRFENITFDIEMDDGIKCGNFDFGDCIPQWMAFANKQSLNEENENESGLSIHHGVACDKCGMHPINGARYKCAVCINYDLCSKCESSHVNETQHPLIKFDLPLTECGEFEFGGLHETIDQLGGPRRVFGRHGRGGGRHGARGRGGFRGAFHGHHGAHHGAFGPGFDAHHHGHHHHGHGFHDYPQMTAQGTLGNEFEHADGLTRFGCGLAGVVPPYHGHHHHHSHHGHGFGGHCQGKKCTRGQQNGEMNEKEYKKAMKKELKQETKEIKNELKKLKKFEKQMIKAEKKEKKESKKHSQKHGKKNGKGKNGLIKDVLCICGDSLSQLLACEAYPESSLGVRCDACDSHCNQNDTIYHCPNGGSLLHPNGYDVCGKCVNNQDSSFVGKSKIKSKSKSGKKEGSIKLSKEEKATLKEAKMEKKREKREMREAKKAFKKQEKERKNEVIDYPSILKKDEIGDISIVKKENAIENENENDNDGNSDNNEDGMDIEEEANGDNDKMDDSPKGKEEMIFIYGNELSQLSQMGFDDNEAVRGLLIEKKGNVGAVIEALLQ